MTAASAKEFVAGISIAELPVFARTIDELAKLALRGERAPLPAITDVVLHDPLLTFRLLTAVNNRRSRLGAEITTVEHAIMMMGVQPFFQRFSQLTGVEDLLKSDPRALAALQRAAVRAHHAGYQARDWAIHRSDIESEEVFVAATLAELPEMVLACFPPSGAPDFTAAELGDVLFDACRVPDLLRDLMDAGRSTHPRTLNVTLANAIARHAEAGWYTRPLRSDMEAAAAFLHMPFDDAAGRIHRTAVLAARAWRWYGAVPAAALLPMLPLPETEEAGRPAPGNAAGAPSNAPGPRTSQELIAWALKTLREKVGLGRVMFALVSPDRQWLRLKWAEGIAPESPVAGMSLSLARQHLFTQLLGKPQSVWLHDANRDHLRPFITAELTKLLGHGDFLAMSIFLKDQPLGVLYADAREGPRKELDEASYHAFKQVGARVSEGLRQLGAKKPV